MNAELRTHLIPFVAVALCLPGAMAAFLLADGDPPVWSQPLAAYLGLGLAMFGASSLFHLAFGTPLEETLNKVDHLGIHVLIAGTGFVHMRVLPAISVDRVPWMVAAVSVLAVAGIGYRALRGNQASNWVVMPLYVLMAATILPTLDWSADLWATPMLLTYLGVAVYALSAALLFPREHLHAWWHRGTVVGYVLMGLPVFVTAR